MARRNQRKRDHVSVLDHIRSLLAEMDLRYQQRFDAQNTALDAARVAAKEGVNAAVSAAEKAVTKAETANEKRFESVNEFRKTLSDQTASFPSRVELQALADRVSDLATRMDKTEGTTKGGQQMYGYIAGAAGLLVGIVGIVAAFVR